jgi:hypothetical protein
MKFDYAINYLVTDCFHEFGIVAQPPQDRALELCWQVQVATSDADRVHVLILAVQNLALAVDRLGPGLQVLVQVGD